MCEGVRCENLEHTTFEDESFDLVITQDVLEHVMHPDLAFVDIARTLKPGGAHIFTVPWFYWKPTFTRAAMDGDKIVHFVEPQYHGNHIDPGGALAVTDWGWDMCDRIYRSSGMTTTLVKVVDHRLGLDQGPDMAQDQWSREVFISRKPLEL